MADALFVLVVVAFFVLAAGFVVACDRIIGPDELPDAGAVADDRSGEAVAR